MAFVFRSQKQPTTKPIPVGPGSYNFDVPRENKIPRAYVPFGSMEPKGKQPLKQPTALVGPGSYNIDVQHSGEKIIVSSDTEDIKILEISRPHPVFKSSVVRFNETKEQLITPGPGQYNFKGLQVRPKAVSTTNNTTKPKILEHLINLNQYQSIPSIPSNIHAFGYNENENNELELNQPPLQYFKGEKEDKVGPGQYNPTHTNIKAKSVSWSQPKAPKVTQPKTNPNIGPGTYETTSINPLCNYKPSSNFASKTMRTMQPRKISTNLGKINEDVQSNQAESRLMSEKQAPSTHIDSDQDSEYEYIDDTTPGPGSYLQISKVSRPKAGKTATSFGASKRFKEKPAAVTPPTVIGPGSYNVGFNFGKKVRQTKPVLVKNQDRCPSLVDKNTKLVPGPGSYEPRNTMEDKLIYKIQRGYRGQFGSTQARGAEPESEERPGPGSYNPQLILDERQVSAAFKSKLQRKMIDDKKVIPPVGSYNIVHNDIATRVIKQEQEDPDLIIKKPGFGVGEERFKQFQKPQQDFEDDDIIKEIQEKHREERKLKMLKNNSVFRSKDQRFKQVRGVAPGPGAYYDGEEDYWNKRTYNILFADI